MKKKPLNILYICPNSYIGGAEKIVLDLLKSHSNDNVTLLTFSKGNLTESLDNSSIDVLVLPFKLKLSNPVSLFKFILYFRNLIRSKSIQLVHSTMPYSHILFGISTFFLNIKELWFQHGPVGGLLDRLGVFFKSDVVICNSSHTLEQHKALPFSINSPQKVISLGVDDNFNQDVSKENNLISWVGRITPSKGLDILVDAIVDNNLVNYKLNIIGTTPNQEDKRYLEKIHQKINNSGMSNNFHFLGHVDNVQDYLSQSKIYVHTTRVPEAFGLTIAEAMICENLVIGSIHGGQKDFLLNQKTGVTYDTFVSHSSTRLGEILKDLKINDNIIKNARENILKNYSKNLFVEKIHQTYQDLMKS